MVPLVPKQTPPNLATRIASGEPCRLLLLRPDVWRRACTAAGLHSDADRARALRMSRSQVNLVQNRQRGVGIDFLVAALRLFPHLTFADLFAIYDNTDKVDKVDHVDDQVAS